MLLNDSRVLLNEQEIKKLIKDWRDVQDLVNYFCESEQINKTLEEIRFLTSPEFSFSFLENSLNNILVANDFIAAYVSNQNIILSLLSIYKNFSNYLFLLNDAELLKTKLNFSDESNELVPFYLVNLNKLKLTIDQIAITSNLRFVEYKKTEKPNFKIGCYETNYSSEVIDFAFTDDDKKDNFIRALSNVEASLKSLDVENSIAHLMYLFRVVENEFSLFFHIINNEYSTLVRRFIHSVIRHDGYLNESQGMKLRHGFQNLSKENQIELLEDAKNYLVTIKLLSIRKNPDLIYKKFSSVITDDDITLPGFIPIEINKIEPNHNSTCFINVHRDGTYQQTIAEDILVSDDFEINQLDYEKLRKDINEFKQYGYEFEQENQIELENGLDCVEDTNIDEFEQNENTELLITEEKIDIVIDNDVISESNSFDEISIDQIQEQVEQPKKKRKVQKDKAPVTVCSPLWNKDETTKQILIDIGVQKKKSYDFDERVDYTMSCNIDSVNLNNKTDLISCPNSLEQNYLSSYLKTINFEKTKKTQTKRVSMKELRKQAQEKMQQLQEKKNNKTKNKVVD